MGAHNKLAKTPAALHRKAHTGSCLCGAIEYSVDDKLEIVVNCHCQYCRLAHGSEFIPVALMASNKLEVLKGKELLSKYEIPNGTAFRCFCSICGTRLYNHSPSAKFISLITATLTQSTLITPIANVNMESRNQSFAQLNGLPNFSAVPGIDELQEVFDCFENRD